ncbi:hypothetical protein NDU88_003276 [Pleurodeles waltl]|uniref:Uncharacterized protein n=1 Tax=Pleurodeles waltl TaxID=8319 RepID=A0AAV7WR76_PLEWA|nr:hypothetical protein NDU88_009643 [Pleurodeles waltl]KAJ1131306.1 hypothetical protein NDU88_009644 [Pleurodeles waltl]KAJ1197679.1 hypothetical protein NDU88_001535 [Pleurodeles waltl]KAJ1197680.1 hypothetical protein NDU88_001536 [Pleurodeles waltl]KAJ1197681.1 hypothetical protein NDU88_001537 [Pleurodeles waltl]
MLGLVVCSNKNNLQFYRQVLAVDLASGKHAPNSELLRAPTRFLKGEEDANQEELCLPVRARLGIIEIEIGLLDRGRPSIVEIEKGLPGCRFRSVIKIKTALMRRASRKENPIVNANG